MALDVFRCIALPPSFPADVLLTVARTLTDGLYTRTEMLYVKHLFIDDVMCRFKV